MTQDAEDNGLDDAERVRLLRRNLRSFAGMMVRTRRLTEASQRHEDRMLTWSVAVMGAALFALPGVLNAGCETTKGYALAAAPWTLGVIVALGGRVIGGWQRDADRLHFVKKLGTCHAVLAQSPRLQTASELGPRSLAIMDNSEPDLKVAIGRVMRLNWWAEKFYYATLAMLAVGIVLLSWMISYCERSLWGGL